MSLYRTSSTATSAALSGTWTNISTISTLSRISYWNMQSQFDCVFPNGPVVGQAFRIVAQATRYGQVPDSAAQIADNAASNQNEVQFFECRFVGLYCVTAQTTPSIVI